MLATVVKFASKTAQVASRPGVRELLIFGSGIVFKTIWDQLFRVTEGISALIRTLKEWIEQMRAQLKVAVDALKRRYSSRASLIVACKKLQFEYPQAMDQRTEA